MKQIDWYKLFCQAITWASVLFLVYVGLILLSLLVPNAANRTVGNDKQGNDAILIAHPPLSLCDLAGFNA